MRKPLRRHLIATSCLLILLVGIGGWAYFASQAAPRFYRDAMEVDRATHVAANDEMLHKATSFYNNVQKQGDWEAIFTAKQINGWLAVDMEENHPDLMPESVFDPRIYLDETGMKLGCRYESTRVSTIFSLDMDLYLAEENVVAMRIRDAKAGKLPLPLSKVLDGVTDGVQRLKLMLEWRTIEGDPVAMITVKPPSSEGDLKVSIRRLELRDGEIYVAGTTNAASRERLDAAFAPSKFIRSD